MKISRKIILSVLLLLFTAPFAFCQTETLKGVVNSLAYYKTRKELKFLTNAKKSIDSLMKLTLDRGLDTNNLEQNVYRAVIYSAILYVDSLNKTGQPENFFRKTVEQVEKLNSRKKIYKFQPEMDFVKDCLANVYIRKGFAYIKITDYANAGQMFLKAHRYAPSFKQLNVYIAYTNNRLGNLSTAAVYYDNIAKTDSMRTDYIEEASNAYKAIGDTAKALEIIKRGRKLIPNDKALLLDEANIYNNKRDYKSLAPLLPQLLDININKPDIVFVAANCYDHLYEYDKAEALYLQAIELNSSAYDPIFNLGLLYLKKSLIKKEAAADKNMAYAQQWLEKAYEISPNNVNCLEVLQVIYAQTGNKDETNRINNKLKQLTNQ
jgi:tetratricopeptide (TPR) repeat protein